MPRFEVQVFEKKLIKRQCGQDRLSGFDSRNGRPET
jgi:hypothetical protein